MYVNVSSLSYYKQNPKFWGKNIVTIMLKHDFKKKSSFIVVPLIKGYTYKC